MFVQLVFYVLCAVLAASAVGVADSCRPPPTTTDRR